MMKKTKKAINKMNTNHVISKNNKVFIKSRSNEWFPINFQWIPIVKLNETMNH